MGDTKLINLKYLENMSGGSKELVKEMAGIFINQIPEFVSEMKSLLMKKEYESLGMLAHKAKSSVAIMGMEELAKNLKHFELLAREGKNTDQYSNYIQEFEETCNNAISELKTIFENI
jgi:HPt (histidine-containing phosphotransfer) domain-containing protein